MHRLACSGLLFSALALSLVLAPAARAQEDADDDLGAPSDAPAGDDATTGTTTTTTTTTSPGAASLGDEQALLEESAPPVESGESGLEPRELEGVDYFFVGVLARGVIVPAFIQSIFVATDATPLNGGFGAFFNYRKNGFNVQLEVVYQGFGVDATYRGLEEPDTETEHIRSQLGLIYGNVSFGWAFDITEWFAFELGFGIGLGGLVGDLYRQAVVPDGAGGYVDCTGPRSGPPGSPAAAYCDDDEWPVGTERPGPNGDAYQITQGRPNPHFFGERGIPPIFFNIDLPRIAFRFKPIRQIQIRVEGAYNLYGFSFGASAGYGF